MQPNACQQFMKKICCCCPNLWSQNKDKQTNRQKQGQNELQGTIHSGQHIFKEQSHDQNQRKSPKKYKQIQVHENPQKMSKKSSQQEQKLGQAQKDYIDQKLNSINQSIKCLNKGNNSQIEGDLQNVNKLQMKKIQKKDSNSEIKQNFIEIDQFFFKTNFHVSSQESLRNKTKIQQAHPQKVKLPSLKKKILCNDELDQIILNKQKQIYNSNKCYLYPAKLNKSDIKQQLVAKLFQNSDDNNQFQFCTLLKQIPHQKKTYLIDILECFYPDENHEWVGILMPKGQKPLSQYMKQLSTLSMKEYVLSNQYSRQVKFIIQSILKGLMQMIELGYVHKDIKPSNIVLLNCQEKQKKIKIIDFGTVCEIDQSKKDFHKKLQGTLHYMAPQLLLGLPIEVKKLDSFSLGHVMHQMFRCNDSDFFQEIKQRQKGQKKEVMEMLKNNYKNQKFYQRYKKKLIDLLNTNQLPISLIMICLKLIQLKPEDRLSIEQTHKLMTSENFKQILNNQLKNLNLNQSQNKTQKYENQIDQLIKKISKQYNLLEEEQAIHLKFFLYLHIMTNYNCQKDKYQQKYKNLEKQLQIQDRPLSETQIEMEKMQQQGNQQQKQKVKQKTQQKTKQYQYMICYLSYSLLKSNLIFQQKYLDQSWLYFYNYRKFITISQNQIKLQFKDKSSQQKFQISQEIKLFLEEKFQQNQKFDKSSSQFRFGQNYKLLNQDHTKQCLKNYLKTLIDIKRQQKKHDQPFQKYIQSLKSFSQLVLKSCKNCIQHYKSYDKEINKAFGGNDNKKIKQQVFQLLKQYIK